MHSVDNAFAFLLYCGGITMVLLAIRGMFTITLTKEKED